MTQEQFERAVEINDRICKLERVRHEIDTGDNSLGYAYRRGGERTLQPEWLMGYIEEILGRHDMMIRQEIVKEIENLKSEIEKL